jgi:hypothetical protein
MFLKNPQYLILGVAAVIFLFSCSLFGIWLSDDAFVGHNFAANLINGHGLVFNIGEKPVEGYSCFLWVLIIALVLFLKIDLLIATNLLGISFGLLSLFMLYKLSYLISGNKKFAAFPSLFLAVMPVFAVWATSGMEPILFTLLLITSVYFFLKEEKEGNLYYSPIFFFLLALTRPEGAVVFLLSFLFRAFKNLKKLKKDKIYQKKFILWTALFLILYGLYTLWRVWYFGDFLPNTFYVKSSMAPWYGNISAMALLFSYIAPFVVLAVIPLVTKKLSSAQKYLLFIIIPMLILIWRFWGWYWAHRYAIPLIALILVFTQYELERIFSITKQQNLLKKMVAFFIPVFLLLYAIYPLPHYVYDVKDGTSMLMLANWFNKYYPNVTMSIGDRGAIKYYTNLTIIDTSGCSNWYIAHKGFSAEYVLSFKPEFIILVSAKKDPFTSLEDPRNEYIKIYENAEFQKKYHVSFKMPTTTLSNVTYYWIYARNDFNVSSKALANQPFA